MRAACPGRGGGSSQKTASLEKPNRNLRACMSPPPKKICEGSMFTAAEEASEISD